MTTNEQKGMKLEGNINAKNDMSVYREINDFIRFYAEKKDKMVQVFNIQDSYYRVGLEPQQQKIAMESAMLGKDYRVLTKEDVSDRDEKMQNLIKETQEIIKRAETDIEDLKMQKDSVDEKEYNSRLKELQEQYDSKMNGVKYVLKQIEVLEAEREVQEPGDGVYNNDLDRYEKRHKRDVVVQMLQASSQLRYYGLGLERQKQEIATESAKLRKDYRELTEEYNRIRDQIEDIDTVIEKIREDIKCVQNDIANLKEQKDSMDENNYNERFDALNKVYTSKLEVMNSELEQTAVLELAETAQGLEDEIYNKNIDNYNEKRKQFEENIDRFHTLCEVYAESVNWFGDLPESIKNIIESNMLEAKAISKRLLEKVEQRIAKECSTVEDLDDYWSYWTKTPEDDQQFFEDDQQFFEKEKLIKLQTSREFVCDHSAPLAYSELIKEVDKLVDQGIDRRVAYEVLSQWNGLSGKLKFLYGNEDEEASKDQIKYKKMQNIHHITGAVKFAREVQIDVVEAIHLRETAQSDDEVHSANESIKKDRQRMRNAIDAYDAFAGTALDLEQSGKGKGKEKWAAEGYQVKRSEFQKNIISGAFIEEETDSHSEISEGAISLFGKYDIAIKLHQFQERFEISDEKVEEARKKWRDFLKEATVEVGKDPEPETLQDGQKTSKDSQNEVSSRKRTLSISRPFFDQYSSVFREARVIKDAWEKIGKEDPLKPKSKPNEYLRILHEGRKLGLTSATTPNEGDYEKEKKMLIKKTNDFLEKYETEAKIDLNQEIELYENIGRNMTINSKEDRNNLYRYYLCDLALRIGENKRDGQNTKSLEAAYENCVIKAYLLTIKHSKIKEHFKKLLRYFG